MGTSDTGVNDSVFENCPYGCNRGRYFNVVEKKWAPCPDYRYRKICIRCVKNTGELYRNAI